MHIPKSTLLPTNSLLAAALLVSSLHATQVLGLTVATNSGKHDAPLDSHLLKIPSDLHHHSEDKQFGSHTKSGGDASSAADGRSLRLAHEHRKYLHEPKKT